MNPEFKRNLWLEMSPTRLAIMPGVLALIGLLVYVLNPDDPQRSLFVAFSVLFVGLTVGWGSLIENNFSVHRPLEPGDVVELEIQGIGILRNQVVG